MTSVCEIRLAFLSFSTYVLRDFAYVCCIAVRVLAINDGDDGDDDEIKIWVIR